tara:strand:- start:6448 stop:7494 length:1047 start_codon:yes stop_codon:yes gene_type:complete
MTGFNNLDHQPYLIAELSSNHNKDLNIVLKSIEAAAKAGANAIKTQLYTADSLTLPDRSKSPIINDKSSPWFGQLLYDLYEEASLPYDWYPIIIKCAKDNAIDLFSSVFDNYSLDYALKLNLPFIKISSFELIHIPLIKQACESFKPCIISTGMSTVEEIDRCVDIFSENRENLCLLKCTSDYPAALESTHISQMDSLSKRYQNIHVGLSDHSLSNLPSIAATVLGAVVIEKHFILNKNLKTPDSFFSLDQDEFTSLVKDVRAASLITKRKDLASIRQDVENHSLWERPSLYFANNFEKGHILLKEDLIIRRPSLGLSPTCLDSLVGNKLKLKVEKYQPTSSSCFEIM